MHTPFTRLRRLSTALALALLVSTPSLQATDILFVGNSFTFTPTGTTEPGSLSGVPAIFKRLATQGGYSNINISMRAVSGQTLTWHQTNSTTQINQAWDTVILQDYSTRTFTPSGVDAFNSAITGISDTLRAQNANVNIFLYETWARPDLVLNHSYESLQEMQTMLHSAYSAAAAANHLSGWVPVGDAFLHAVNSGQANDPSTPANEGPLSLWGSDNYHQSVTGSYLAAVLFYHDVLGGDISLIPTGTGSVAAGLGISQANANMVHTIALQTIPEPSSFALIACASVAGILVTRRRFGATRIPPTRQLQGLL